MKIIYVWQDLALYGAFALNFIGNLAYKAQCARLSQISRSVNCDVWANLRFVYALCGYFALNLLVMWHTKRNAPDCHKYHEV